MRQIAIGLAMTHSLLAVNGGAFAAEPVHIPSAGGEVVLPTEADQHLYDSEHFAAIRRAGDFLYISGVIAGRAQGEGNTVDAFKQQLRRAFRHIQASLRAVGADFPDVVMINSFHVWNSENFSGTRDEQFAAFESVKDEFMLAPHPAWTAVGTTGLLADRGVVEIQMIAYLPKDQPTSVIQRAVDNDALFAIVTALGACVEVNLPQLRHEARPSPRPAF